MDRVSDNSFRCLKLVLNWETQESGQLPDTTDQKLLERAQKCMIMGSSSYYQREIPGKGIILWVRDGVRERVGMFEYGHGATVINDKMQTLKRTGGSRWHHGAEREWVRLA
jgi:hypothetical protein